MRFAYQVSKLFIGQEKVVRQLSTLAEEISSGVNINILLEAPSGYGKNYLSYLFLEFLDSAKYENSVQYLPSGGVITFDYSKRFHYIDEAHLLRPQEQIYTELSSGDYTIIVATNMYDKLAEAVLTRCVSLRFAPYSDEEIAMMIYLRMKRSSVSVPFSFCKAIAEYCRGTPRIADNYAQRMSFIFRTYGIPSSENQVHEKMYEYLGQNEGGFTEFDMTYLAGLQANGGTASLETLIGVTGIPRKVIVQDIEPFLIRKGRIQKTSRGRKIMEVQND